MKVAFLGLGRMGSAIAANIITKGVATTVWNRTESKMGQMARLGAKTAITARQAVRDADIVVTSLMDDASVTGLLHGEDGILAGMHRGATHLCTTTISPLLADELARIHSDHGTRYVSGPILGRPAQAEAGTLKAFLSGDKEGLSLARLVSEKYSDFVRVVDGPARAANVLKLCLNYSALSIIEMIGEVYTFAEKSGSDPALVNDFYQVMFSHPAMKEYAGMILHRDFQSNVGFSLAGGQKDLNLMLDLAAQQGFGLGIGSIVKQKMADAIQDGWKDADWSSFTTITRRRAGL